MSVEKAIKTIMDRVFELKQDAWESNRNATEYVKGYWWGIYYTCLEIEKLKEMLKDVWGKQDE